MRKIFSQYLSDPTFAQLCSDAAFVENMVRVELALARAQGNLDIIPKAAADEIVEQLPGFNCDLEALAESTLKNGIPTIGFLTQAHQVLSEEAQDYLHWGVTSQDITDTALVLLLKDVSQEVETRLKLIIKRLESLAKTHEKTQLAARTRNQMAVPITFSQKVDSWKNPLKRQLDKITEIRPGVFRLQLAGADGRLSMMGTQVGQLRKKVADELGLAPAEGWHSQRDNLVEFSDLLGSVAASLGKMGGDVLILTQTEVGELSESTTDGGSSSMPHKSNPVRSEALVALAQHSVNLSSGLKQGQIHKNERDGSSLCLEWLLWPQLVETVGACLSHAGFLTENLQVHPEAMRRNISGQNGLLYSEKAVYLLAEKIGRAQAKKSVARASRLVLEKNISLTEALQMAYPDLDIDWNTELF